MWDVDEKDRRDDNSIKMQKEKNDDEWRRTADDGQTENNYKTPRGGGNACWFVYWQKKYWLYKPTDRRTTEDGG